MPWDSVPGEGDSPLVSGARGTAEQGPQPRAFGMARYGPHIFYRAQSGTPLRTGDGDTGTGPLLRRHQAHFFIAGTGPLRQSLEALSCELGAGGFIHFMGQISEEELVGAYAAADLFILPTVTLECFGLITLEALSHGCPVLSTDAGAIPESMQPILPHMIVAAGDVAALAEKAGQFLLGAVSMPKELHCRTMSGLLMGKKK